MNKFTKKDLAFSVITGFITGLVAWRIFEFLGIARFQNISFAWLMIFVPLLWICGVNLGYFLGRWVKFFNQFGKFAAIGFTNAMVYFGILNILIHFTGFNRGVWYSAFVAGSFVIAVAHSYIWNKLWVFESAAGKMSRKEFSKFFGVYLVAGFINVGIASGVVNFASPWFGLTLDQWANFGGIAGSAVALVFSFIGLKSAVFRK